MSEYVPATYVTLFSQWHHILATASAYKYQAVITYLEYWSGFEA